jgi:glutamyl-tRNA reductase
VEELTRELENPRVLMIGVGEMGANVCLNFGKSKINNLFITNRTHHKAVDLAQRANGCAVPWEQVMEQVQLADVVISAVPGDVFYISQADVQAQGLTGPKYFLDLSMPRSIEEGLGRLPAVEVYNVDAIKNRASEALGRRLAAIPQVHQILDETLAEFESWTREMVISPTIQQFKNQLEQIRQQEIARALKHMGPAEQQLIEAVTANMLNKIVKLPVLELKAACRRGESESLLEGLAQLFNLEKQPA